MSVDPPESGNPFDAWTHYYKVGFLGTLILPYKLKDPPPGGFTGKRAPYPTVEQINEWANDGQKHNLCLRLGPVNDEYEVIGIDVDHYVKAGKKKNGGDQLKRLEEQIGPLPDTWISSSRDDGVSGVRYFLVPAGLKINGKADKDIEVIQKGHRYAVVWPSIHPEGNVYWWYPPGSDPTDDDRSAWDGNIPDPNTLPGLSDAWIDYLSNNRTLLVADDLLSDEDSSVDEMYDWATATFHGDDDSEPCPRMREKLDKHLKKLSETATFHDLLTNAHWNLAKLAYEGHHGWFAAFNEYEKAYFNAIVTAGGGTTTRTPAELAGEIFRSRIGALRRIKGESDKNLAIDARPISESCYRVDLCKQPEPASETPIFRQYGPTDWAKPVAPTRFLIKRVLSTDTWGVNSGPKKSLKTHDNQAIGLAVATGTNLYNDARFAVPKPGKVLYIVGEGGSNQVRRVLHRMLHAYGIKPEDVARDPDFPFVVVFGVAPLNSSTLREEIKGLLDDHQPALVLMESFYNFHPDVTASNLFERGPLIDGYHKLVRSGGENVVSLLTDHHKKSSTGIDLDDISMSGQAENADSWIQRMHRNPPEVHTGDFWLTTGFNSRDWGGNTFDVDWHLGPFDHDAGAHTGHISWDVHDHVSQKPFVNMITKSQRKEIDVVASIARVLTEAHDKGVPGLNQRQMIDGIKTMVPDAGPDFVRRKLDQGEKEGDLIALPGQKNSTIYALTTHSMYSHD